MIAGSDAMPTGRQSSSRGRMVILSPHPDDAVWALGGALPMWRTRGEVLVVSVFDGDALSQGAAPPHRWRGGAHTPLRRREDQAALEMLACPLVSLAGCDAALRLNDAGDYECASPDALFIDGDYGSWPEVPVSMQSRLHALLLPGDTLVAPLALGRHLDHCIVHKLARQTGAPMLYYGEFPYFLSHGGDLARHAEALGLTLREDSFACDWSVWLAAAGRYRSQVLRLFGSHANFSEQLASYGSASGPVAHFRIWSAS